MPTRRTALSILHFAPLLLASCVLESNDQARIVGEPCVDVATCGPGLMCFFPEPDPQSGTCIEPPPACDVERSCDCLAELEPQCDAGLNCLGVVGEFTAACVTASSRRQLGESRAFMVPCAGDLLCLMPTYGEAGVCGSRPPCLDDLNYRGDACDCLVEYATTACASGTGSCYVFGDAATLQCS